MCNISKNKNQLENYLIDFHPDKKNEILILFENFDFGCGTTSFSFKMKSLIGMPKFGKKTLIYWISRGWDDETAKVKRLPTIRDVETSPMNIIFWLKRGFSLEESKIKIKSQRKMNKEYWIERGFSMEDSIIKSKEFQKNSNKINISTLDTDNSLRDIVSSKRSNNINYWLNKGFNLEESKIKLSDRQSTFSLEKCISKYGNDEGERVWAERQKRWQKSLIESEYNGIDNKDSKSIHFFKKKYGDFWIENYIQSVVFIDKEDIRYLLSFENYKDMILTLINDNLTLSHISYRLRYSILCEIYNTCVEDMYSFLVENYEYDYGRPSYYERMYGEKWIDEFIKSNNYKNKEDVLFLLSFENYFKLIDYLIDNFSITDIVLKIKNVIISYFYKTTYEKIFEYLMSVNPNIKGKFGYMRYYNNHLCRSSGEFLIAKFLKDNEISYKYEKSYPNSKKRCDFYLIDRDFYIEYTGMYKIEKYNEKYNEKLLFCIDNNIKHIFSNNVKDIETKIKSIYGI
jgi:hypothetical protein